MKKGITLLLSMILLIGSFCGCGSEGTVSRTIRDLNGNTVSLPATVTAAASNSASVTSQIVMMAGADAVKIAPASFESGHTERFEELFEGTDKIPLAEGNKISAETLLEAGVNVFFTTKQSEADEYAKAGLTCIVLNFDTIENIAQTYVIMGNVFGGEALEKGQKISDGILNSQFAVKQAVSTLSGEERPSVYYISASTQTSPYLTQGAGTSTDTLLTMCGAEHITSGTGIDVTVNAEFLLENDPDYILIDGYLADQAREELINDPVLGSLTAVKEENIIIAPVGLFRPWMRPGAESGLGLIWLASTFCPEQMADISVEDTAMNFYNDCFGWDLSREEIRQMLNWAG